MTLRDESSFALGSVPTQAASPRAYAGKHPIVGADVNSLVLPFLEHVRQVRARRTRWMGLSSNSSYLRECGSGRTSKPFHQFRQTLAVFIECRRGILALLHVQVPYVVQDRRP
jgi:hypothetical protein